MKRILLSLALVSCAPPHRPPVHEAPRPAASAPREVGLEPGDEPLSTPIDSHAPGGSGTAFTAVPAGRVGGGLKAASDTVEPDVVRRVVRASYPRLKHCYGLGLTRDRALEGRVSVQFVIDRHGRTAGVSSYSSLGSLEVVQCIEKTFYSLQFPAPSGDRGAATYLLVFTPQA
jgi:hypothetical protein